MYYKIVIKTGTPEGAGTDANVRITLNGQIGGWTPYWVLDNQYRDDFVRDQQDTFVITNPGDLGALRYIYLYHDNTCSRPAWYIDNIYIVNLNTGQEWYFPV